ncbi:MAG TPA: LpqB family beta-propeller domain-containing protein, partial [Actinomycetales bacterium]|nr:LpqB family beta-propeller domain-containing protein [Actinomycetales bacterium]
MSGHDFERRPVVRARVLAAAMAMLCLISACAQIPTNGSVQAGLDELDYEPRSGYLLASGPTPGANRVEIVQGFLRAISAGPEDDFAVAREYLTEDARRTWSPAERIVVHPTSSSLEPLLDDQDSVHLMTAITATLDREGRYSQAASGAEEEFTFTLVEDSEGEWRISQAPDATLMSAANFDFLYRATPIYFASQDRERLVAELRWFSERNQATAAAEAVLSGPAPWLQDAVFQPAPAGVRLSTEGVVIEDGVATVGLSDQILTASLEARGVLAAEMQQTLLRVPGVHAVELQSDSVPLVAEIPTIDREPIATGTLMALSVLSNDGSGGEDEGGDEERPVLLEYTDGVFNPLEDLILPDRPQDFAVSLAEPRVVAVAHPEGISRVREDGEPVMLLEQKSVRSISWDRRDWLWVSKSGTESQLIVINVNGEYQELAADWLVGREVIEARVARDGARVLIISR